MTMSRRTVIGGLAASAGLAAPAARAAECALTPFQTEGPFFPVTIREIDADLTLVRGEPARAAGQVIEVWGRVLDGKCNPLASAVVEVWQANAAGRYAHPADKNNPAPIDPGFQGYARLIADARGGYRFLTVKPGGYKVSDDWSRPPHIHFKVTPVTQPLLITQMYFAGEPLNEADRVLGEVYALERERVIVADDGSRADGVPSFAFDLVVGAG